MVPDLAFDGVREAFPVVGFGSGFGAAKGTARFFSSNNRSSTNQVLASFLLRVKTTGSFTIRLHPFNTLGETEQIFVDGLGRVLDPGLSFGIAEVVVDGRLEISSISGATLNPQTGLFEQKVTIRNGRTYPIAGIRLKADSLPTGWVPQNHRYLTNNLPVWEHRSLVQAGQPVELTLVYKVPGRNPTSSPTYSAEILEPQPASSSSGSLATTLSPRSMLGNGAFLIEFSSASNRSYLVQYSENLSNWLDSPPVVHGNGSRVQWIDSGPPLTPRLPSSSSNRFYRILLLPAASGNGGTNSP